MKFFKEVESMAVQPSQNLIYGFHLELLVVEVYKVNPENEDAHDC